MASIGSFISLELSVKLCRALTKSIIFVTLQKLNLSLCLTMYHTMTMYPVLNYAPCHEDVLGSGSITSAPDKGEWSA
jgi:hypothetical protein